MWLVPRGIHRHILLLTLGLVTGASLLIGITALFVFYQYSNEIALNHNQEIAEFLAKEINALIERAVVTNERIAGHVLDVDGSIRTGGFLGNIADIVGPFGSLCIVDQRGLVTYFYPEDREMIGEDLKDRSWVANVMNSQKTFISEPHLEKDGNRVVVIGSPIRTGDGRVVGVLGGSLHLDETSRLIGLVSELKMDNRGYAKILSGQGNYIYHPEREQIMMHARYNTAVQEVLQGRAGFAEVENIKGSPMLVGYAPVSGLGWGVVVEMPKKEAQKTAENLQKFLLMIVGFICAFVFAVIFFEIKRILRPLSLFSQGVQRVADGDYNFEVDIKGRDEIGQLAHSYNKMVRKIRIMREESEEQKRQLNEMNYKVKVYSKNEGESYYSILDELCSPLQPEETELIASIEVLPRSINDKDRYTYGHSKRVYQHAISIARKLKLPENDIKYIGVAAYLHDIGKIEVSSGILNKKGKLNEEEFDKIKQHPFWGAAIVKNVESLTTAVPMIKFHHELVNGTGYPLGLMGEQIPLGARIIAVADSFNAMISHRPYREKLTCSEAINELKTYSGIHYDVQVVEAFVRVLKESEISVTE